ncbi:hypothetical protein CHS0354_011734 [Potamilus streckersoni]|uniref:Uncharacterized protein n=1 Tax=Potamilus streckersoni TaxID=2493646 RepID=A0AAE0VWV9_9BIVA|nr:hypothetical protein CHS0354_011734 [Potamilus streckersoni]
MGPSSVSGYIISVRQETDKLHPCNCSISLGFNVIHGGKVPIPTDGKKAQMIASLAVETIGYGAKLLRIKNAWRQSRSP